MYTLDGLYSVVNNPNKNRFLSGDNKFIKCVIIEFVKHLTMKPIFHLTKTSVLPKKSLFNNSNDRIIVFSENRKLETTGGVLLKLSDKKATKTVLSEYNMEEIVCNSLFDNQVVKFVDICCKLFGITLNYKNKLNLCSGLKDDLEGLYNLLKISSLTGRTDDIDLTNLDTSIKRLVDYTIKQDIPMFLKTIDYFSGKNLFGYIWMLILKFKEIGDAINGNYTIKNAFLKSEFTKIVSKYNYENVLNILPYLLQLLERVKGTQNKGLVILAILRINKYIYTGDKKWIT